ncbi:hypothetical protein ABZ234_02885 [Nocardiopsis sp. NPDC006198]|uniref:imine reductase family protein n=1 Tax=Nocardiopsis sp. NPDC006198 TaxID=3154472 RepID=UPI0033B0F117
MVPQPLEHQPAPVGITAEEFLPRSVATTASPEAVFRFCSPRIDEDRHTGDADRLSMAAAGVEHVVATSKESGVDATLPSALLEISRRGPAGGQGSESFTSLPRVLSVPASG